MADDKTARRHKIGQWFWIALMMPCIIAPLILEFEQFAKIALVVGLLISCWTCAVEHRVGEQEAQDEDTP